MKSKKVPTTDQRIDDILAMLDALKNAVEELKAYRLRNRALSRNQARSWVKKLERIEEFIRRGGQFDYDRTEANRFRHSQFLRDMRRHADRIPTPELTPEQFHWLQDDFQEASRKMEWLLTS